MKLISLVIAFGIIVAISPVNAESVRTNNEIQSRIYEIASGLDIGQKYVSQYSGFIYQHALASHIDPDWIKAIIIVEAIRPNSDAENRIPPTGLDSTKWIGLDGVSIEQFSNVDTNIRLCALLLQRIRDRILENKRSFSLVASLYDNIETTTVSQYGLKAEKVFKEKGWLKQ
jgi:hypothetical protein